MPGPALLMSTILVQVMLVVTMFAAAYALQLVLTGETYDVATAGYGREFVVALLATVNTAFLLFAAGPKFILVSFVS